MTQIQDIVRDIADMTDEELRDKLSEIRNRRLQAPERVKKTERKKAKSNKSKADKILAGMSQEELKKLMEKYQ
ncbi:MAG: hypothetical protein ACTSXE_02730 [Candidatus Thorarchaeota archaeon]